MALIRLEWPEKVKLMQRNWIGKSEGAKFCSAAWNNRYYLYTRPVTTVNTLWQLPFLLWLPTMTIVGLVLPIQKIVLLPYGIST